MSSLVLSVALALVAQGPPVQEEALRLRLHRLEGEPVDLALERLEMTDPRERGAWRVEPLGFPEPAVGSGSGPAARIALADGTSLRGRLLRGRGEALEVELGRGVRVAVGIDHVRSLWVAGDERDAGAEPADAPLPGWGRLEAPEEGDRLYRRASGRGTNLDAIDGTIESFEEDGVRFDSQALGVRSYPWEEVAALFVEVLAAGDEPAGDGEVPVVVDLAGGSRLRGTLLDLTPTECRFRARIAADELSVPWALVDELVVDDGTLLFLSDLPAREEVGRGAPFGDELGMVWGHRVDRCVYGDAFPLRCHGRVYRRGIGTHAPTRVTWDLPDGVRLLRGSVGIDDRVLWNAENARGAVVFRVLLDGKAVWESPVLTGGAPPVALPAIELEGARELTLESDSLGAFEGDAADWLEMVLVR